MEERPRISGAALSLSVPRCAAPFRAKPVLPSSGVQHPLRVAGARRVTVVGIAIALVIPVMPASAFGAGDSLSAAQARITSAQEAANRASAAYDDAQARYFQLQDDADLTRKAIAAARVQQEQLLSLVRDRAVQLYVRAGSAGFEVFQETDDVLDASRRVTLAAVASEGDDAVVGQLRAATDDLHAREHSLADDIASAKDVSADLHAQEEDLQHAVADAQRAEQQLRVRLEAERRADEYDAIVARAHNAANASQPTGDGASTSTDDGPGQIIGRGDWVCPVQGGVSFTDTFGAPRGNGRTHKGVDMFAAIGTPLVAVVSGSVFFQSDTLGGLAAYVQGVDGNTYYYAHLVDYVGGGRSVSAGELIGHVGNTGDASDAPPQLHFEIRPGGPNGIAIDPYPTVAAHC
jgi:murein DD-endopeptidase MepM/ murein hydrolase activator NlpD